ncbi:MAG: type II toxin-antitoxin system RelE/ParE family toxin [Verrucomicrobiae bacterium]|nr:type II toxin-antitoxin system RelE/ParE family toxin [Verrucomicrobiae bacterium]
MKPCTFHSQAAVEYAEAIERYAAIRTELGERFVSEVDGLLQDIAVNPRRYPHWNPPHRRHFSEVFPYAIIYRDEPDRVWILAVMHMSRHPDYWKERVSSC